MPTVSVFADVLFDQIGRKFTDQEFEDLCFEFGIELEDVTSEQELAAKEGGAAVTSAAAAVDGPGRTVYRIDIPANRYDMLCVEGIARAVRCYLGIAPAPVYAVAKPATASGRPERLVVMPETADVRPFIVAAILRNITFTKDSYNSFIELQDKLHNNICRKRTLVAIGTHDVDTIDGPFMYAARVPGDISFVPLNQGGVMTGDQLMTFYESDRKLNKFLHIIRDKPRYPVVLDSKDRVLSLPPIINGDHSKIKLTTRNVLIECTATDLVKAKIVLNTMVTMFSYYCNDKYTVEPVEVVYPNGESHVYPDLSHRRVDAKASYINSCVGVSCTPDDLVSLISRMSLKAKLSDKDQDTIHVDVPPTRSDVLHACDVMEDAAIAYNFNRIVETQPKAHTVAVPLPINKLADSVRREIARAGYTEVLPFTLCSHDENYAYLNRVDPGTESVRLSNPKTIEYQIVRTSLLPGILKTAASNKHTALPLKVFEVSDVVLRDESCERRARNQRNCCVLYSNKTSGFELIHGIFDRIMMALDIPRIDPTSATISKTTTQPGKNMTRGYYITESTNDTFFPGRRADVYLAGDSNGDDAAKPTRIGTFGIVHPRVLGCFDIGFPCSALEMNVEPFL